MKKYHKCRQSGIRGQVLFTILIAIIVIFVFIQVVINISQLVMYKIKVQNIVDFAALSAAHIRGVFLDSGPQAPINPNIALAYTGAGASHATMMFGYPELSGMLGAKSARLPHVNERIMDMFKMLVSQVSGAQCTVPLSRFIGPNQVTDIAFAPLPIGVFPYYNCRNIFLGTNEWQTYTYERLYAEKANPFRFHNIPGAIVTNAINARLTNTCCDYPTIGYYCPDNISPGGGIGAGPIGYIRAKSFIEQEIVGYLDNVDRMYNSYIRYDRSVANSARVIAYVTVKDNLPFLKEEEIHVFSQGMHDLENPGGLLGKVECIHLVPYYFLSISTGFPGLCEVQNHSSYYHSYDLAEMSATLGQNPALVQRILQLAQRYCGANSFKVPRRILYDPLIDNPPTVTVGIFQRGTPHQASGLGRLRPVETVAETIDIGRKIPFTYSNFSSVFGRKFSPTLQAWAAAAPYRRANAPGIVSSTSYVYQKRIDHHINRLFEYDQFNMIMKASPAAFILTALTGSGGVLGVFEELKFSGNQYSGSRSAELRPGGAFFYSQNRDFTEQPPFPWNYNYFQGADAMAHNPLVPGLIPLMGDDLGTPSMIMSGDFALANPLYYGRSGASPIASGNPLKLAGGVINAVMGYFKDQGVMRTQISPVEQRYLTNAQIKH